MSGLGYSAAVDAPGYNSRADRGPYLIRVCCAMIALSATAVTLRFLTRRLSKVALWWDDWLILIALPCSWAPSVLMICSTQNFNFGKHLIQATPSDIKNFWLFLYAWEIIYPTPIVLIKLSILLFLYRIFHIPQFKLYASMIAITVGAWGAATILVAIFTCNPIDTYWNIMIPHRECIDTLDYFLGVQVPNMILDLIIMILPLPYLWNLHITLSQKIALSGIFILGGFMIVVAGLRLETIAAHQNSADFTYDFIDLGIWTAVETNMGILCACIPTMKPLLRLLTHGTLKSSPTPYPQRGESQRSWPKSSQLSYDTRTPSPLHAAKLNKPRRANHTASSSWGFNQPVPIYSKEAICDVYDLGYDPGLEEMGSPRMGRMGRGGCVEWYDVRREKEEAVGRRQGWI